MHGISKNGLFFCPGLRVQPVPDKYQSSFSHGASWKVMSICSVLRVSMLVSKKLCRYPILSHLPVCGSHKMALPWPLAAACPPIRPARPPLTRRCPPARSPSATPPACPPHTCRCPPARPPPLLAAQSPLPTPARPPATACLPAHPLRPPVAHPTVPTRPCARLLQHWLACHSSNSSTNGNGLG